ncbi:AraC family transcriptional regulator N-terminal domain-containing protein [Allopusillimonas ginsengisoli]|uniref:AraC family transcriptional regulator n=1 Tax=Allopusillimonas ginsengisoli TaxID=453575 RepID=UPI0039C37C99
MHPKTTLPVREIAQIEALRSPMVSVMTEWTQGVNEVLTPISSLRFFRREGPTQPDYCMLEPNVSFVVQGTKRALLTEETYTYDINRFLITSLDLPAMMHIVEACPEKPYLGLMLKLDLRVLSEVMLQSGITPPAVPPSERGMFLGETTPTLLEGFARLVSLLKEPASIPVLAPLIEREIYYRLLTSDQCTRLWQIAAVGSQSHRIARAIDWLRLHFNEPMQVEALAVQVQMSTSTFHQHFRNMTSMSPLQYQKWLRLNEARKLMLSDDLDASTAAFQVGYESPSQFSREYSRFFGMAPSRDIEGLRKLAPTP